MNGKNYVLKNNEDSLVMQDVKDRFMNILNQNYSHTFETVLTEYIHTYGDTISADQCCQIIELLSGILYPKIAHLNHVKRVSNVHAGYLEKYLSGEMYTTDEAFKSHRDIQRKNAQAIIDICNK